LPQKTTASQTHFGFNNIGSNMYHFYATAVWNPKISNETPCKISNCVVQLKMFCKRTHIVPISYKWGSLKSERMKGVVRYYELSWRQVFSYCSLQNAACWSIRPGNKWQIKRADPEMYPFDTSCLSQSFYFCCIIMRIAEAVAQLITRLLSLQWTFLESSRNSSQTNFKWVRVVTAVKLWQKG